MPTSAFLVCVLLLFQGSRIERIFEKAIDDTYAVAFLRESTSSESRQRLILQSRNDRNLYWNLETFVISSRNYSLLRADRRSVVLFRSNDYGFGDYLKIFFDTGSKRIVKRIEFSKTELSQLPTAEVLQVLGVPAEFLKELNSPVELGPPPQNLVSSFPQSTYEEFQRARPLRVRNGYTRRATTIEENVVAYVVSENRVWFGKSFYDGEGTSGVGDLGVFDLATKKYTFFRIPQLAAWSVSYLLVEGDVLWASLVGHPEGADYSGGLFRYDVKSGTTKTFPVDAVISRIARWADGLYIASANGVYILKGDQLTRHRVEPAINGKPTIYSEQLQ